MTSAKPPTLATGAHSDEIMVINMKYSPFPNSYQISGIEVSPAI
jgi:hypothetical protein